MRIRWHPFIVGLFGAAAALAGPFSDVPRNDPLYDTFRFLKEQGVLARTSVELPAEGALTRYEFAVATVDALDYLTALLERAEAAGATAPSTAPPEVQRCHEEVRKLLREFRPELQKLGMDVSAETRKMDRFLKVVRSLHPADEALRASQPTPTPTEPSRAVGGSAAPVDAGLDRLTAQEQAALALRPPRDAEEVQEVLERTRLLTPTRAGRGTLNGEAAGFSRYTLRPPFGPGGPAAGELSLRTSFGGTRLQIIHAARTEDYYRTEPYDLYGARATFGLFGGTAGLTYLRTEAEAAQGKAGESAEGRVYGADMRLPLGEYGMYLEYARSQAPDLRGEPGRAFEAGVSGPLASNLTVGAAYRAVEASFQSPGFWGALGDEANPTNIRGFRLTGDYRPQDSLRLLSSYERYSPLTMAPDLGLDRALANLEYGLNDKVALSVGYESVRRLRLGEEQARSITAGFAYDLSDNVFFHLHYRHSLQDDRLRPTATDNNIAVSEFSVRF